LFCALASGDGEAFAAALQALADAAPGAEAFTPGDADGMRERLADPLCRAHVEHCFWQLARFAVLAGGGTRFRALQFGLNLGRVQELLGSPGGAGAWWRPFKRLCEAEDWLGVLRLALSYAALVGVGPPDLAFVAA